MKRPTSLNRKTNILLVTFGRALLIVLLVAGLQTLPAFADTISKQHNGVFDVLQPCDGWFNFSGSSIVIIDAPMDARISSIDVVFDAYHPLANDRIGLTLIRNFDEQIDIFDGENEGTGEPRIEHEVLNLRGLSGHHVNGMYTLAACLYEPVVEGATVEGWLIRIHYNDDGGGGEGVGSNELIVPASAHVSGVAGSNWRTDLEITAVGGNSATFSISLLEERRANNNPLQVLGSIEAGEAVRFSDVLGETFGFEGIAALRITPITGQIVGSSRTYNDSPNGSYGQFIPAQTATQAAQFGEEALLLQLANNPVVEGGFRSNIGLVNLVDDDLRVRIVLYHADGTQLGSISRIMAAFAYEQINDVLGVVGMSRVDDAYAVVRTEDQGGAFIAYASVIDNQTNDPGFVQAQVVKGGN